MKKIEVEIEDQADHDLTLINKSLDAIGVMLSDDAQPNLVDRAVSFFAGILKGVRE